MGKHLSRYGLLSKHTYLHKGKAVRLLYFTLRPSLLLIPATDAQALLSTAFSPAQDNYDTYEEMGLLTSLTAQQELQQIIHQFKQGTPGTRIFALMPTSLCNMCCSYCGQNNCALRFSANTAASIQERIKVALSQPNLEAIEIRWYGGEPLMAYHEILRLSHEIIPDARKHELKYRATMSTNGSLMTYKRLRCLYDEALLRSLVVTIDGYGNYHDTSRVMRSGRPTYEWITDWLSKAASNIDKMPSLHLAIRVNVTVNNFSSIDTLIDDLAAKGIAQKNVELEFIPVYDWGGDNSNLRLSAHQLDISMMKWMSHGMQAGFTVRVLPTLPCRNVCIATNKSAELIDSLGNIYSCTEQPLVPAYEGKGILGNVESEEPQSLRPQGEFDHWAEEIGQGRYSNCRDCPMLPVCGGSCPKRWHEGVGNCPAYARQLQLRLDLLAQSYGLERAD